MDRANRSPTLLPYLEPVHAGFRLNVLRTGDDRPAEDRPGSPFRVVSDSGPFTRIIAAQVAGAGPVPVKKAFLLLSKDFCPARTGGIVPVTNLLVEESWQRIFRQRRGSVVTLAGQEDGSGDLLPFSSLFFCRAAQAFFHPPCPACGRDLRLCRDDAVLRENGLAPYSTTMKRYLYCPACLPGQGPADFYAFAPTGDEPACVKDLHALVEGFGRLSGAGSLEGPFPCPACPSRAECYGEAGLASKRIVPFSFYPFYLLVFEPAALNAFDFLALLSGAGISELQARLTERGETGRLHSVGELAPALSQGGRLFFTQGEGRFLETLYLKCAFLSQLAQLVLSGAGACRFPDLAGSSDRLWVSLPQQGRGLPFFWNFSLELIEMDQAVPTPMPPSYGSYMLGLLWFQALAANSLHDASRIGGALSGRIDALMASPEGFSPGFSPIDGEHVFDPANIFWNPEAHPVRGEWIPLWRKALDLGWSLLANGMKPDASFSASSFMEDLDLFLEQVKQELFSLASAAPESVRRSPDEDIGMILEDIIASYEAGDESMGAPHRAQGEKSPEGHVPDPAPPVEQAPGQGGQSPLRREDGTARDGAETVVLAPDPTFITAEGPSEGEIAGEPGTETAMPGQPGADAAACGQDTVSEQAGSSIGGEEGRTPVRQAPGAVSDPRQAGLDPEDSHETIILDADLARTLMGGPAAEKAPQRSVPMQGNRPGEAPGPGPRQTGAVPGDGGEGETLIITPAGPGLAGDLPETAVMDILDHGRQESDGQGELPSATGGDRFDDPAETVIMKPGPLSVDDSPETVIVKSGHQPQDDAAESLTAKPGRTPADDAPETVVMDSSPAGNAGGPGGLAGTRNREKESSHSGHDDSLEETLIITPGKGRE